MDNSPGHAEDHVDRGVNSAGSCVSSRAEGDPARHPPSSERLRRCPSMNPLSTERLTLQIPEQRHREGLFEL